MKQSRIALFFCAVMSASIPISSATFGELIGRATELEQSGQFAEAESLLARATQDSAFNETERRGLDFARERLLRIRREYRLTRDDLFNDLQKSVRGLTPREFEQWVRNGRFDSRIIDGVRRFANPSVSNLYFRYPALNARRINPVDSSAEQHACHATAQPIRAASQESGRPMVLPKRLEVTMSAAVKPGSVAPGTIIRAWLPVPRAYPFQTDFVLLESSSKVLHIADPNSPIRSAYLEQPPDDAGSATFRIRYAYTSAGVWFNLDPKNVPPRWQPPSELEPFLRETQHVVFTDTVRNLSRRIIGTEKNPVKRARLLYNWVSDHIMYSYAPEYSTITNLTEFCLARGYGDCGMQALLFITMCRLNGIPARWQSGWRLAPGSPNIHDWCEIYLPPWGWIPVDPYMGVYATRYATNLSAKQRRELRDFHFGGLSQYRMIANSDHCKELFPEKTSHRSDNVDFQRGELEAAGHNLYFDKFSYSLTWKEIPGEVPPLTD
ncbi:MAG: transglutaminase-like domain-containing protein [Verrucomicrobiia bacterium]